MVTVAPWLAELGLTEVMTGLESTVKLLVVVAVAEPTFTEIGPVVAPEGTVTVSVVAVAAVTVAVMPLN